MIQVRKLVAVELTFLGPKIVFAEYGFAVLGGAVIAIISSRVGLLRTYARWQVLLGIYLLFLALTYAVLLGLAIAMARRGDAREEAAGELHDLRYASSTADNRSGFSFRWSCLWPRSGSDEVMNPCKS